MIIEGVETINNEYNAVFAEEDKIIKSLANEVNTIWNILYRLNMLDNKKWRFQWRRVYDGYHDRPTILDSKKGWRKKILLYDIDEKDCYRMLVEKDDDRIFEAITEACLCLGLRISAIRENIEKYKLFIEDQIKITDSIIKDLNDITRD